LYQATVNSPTYHTYIPTKPPLFLPRINCPPTHKHTYTYKKMESITAPISTDHPLNQDRKKGGDRATARRQFFPRASGLPRGKVRTAGASEHASKTNVGDM
jgi:hypothetical protein